MVALAHRATIGQSDAVLGELLTYPAHWHLLAYF
jgi:hypothetical protein